MAPRPTFYPRIAAVDTPSESVISTTIRNNGYPEDSAIPHEEYNEIFNEIDKWIEYLAEDGNYVSLGLVAGDVALVGATGTVTVESAFYRLKRYAVSLDVVVSLSSISGTLTGVNITLPTIARCVARYVGSSGRVFSVVNTATGGDDSLLCTASFASANNILNVKRPATTLGNYTEFLLSGASGNKFSISIEYERLVA